MTGTDTSLNINKTVKELIIFTEPLSSGHTSIFIPSTLVPNRQHWGGGEGRGGSETAGNVHPQI